MSKLKRLYKEIWDNRPHVCEVCNKDIPYMVAHNFSHIHSKGARPDLKYDKRNIQIWCSSVQRKGRGCHELWSTDPEGFWERANKHGWTKPEIEPYSIF